MKYINFSTHKAIASSQSTSLVFQVRSSNYPYQQDRSLINCNTNNGVKRQNKSFKYEYLQKHLSSLLTGMLTILIEDFLLADK